MARSIKKGPYVTDSLLKKVEAARGEFIIISSLHEAGRKLDSLGGVAALLRYRIE